jgi:large subunit ribosomal protein L23
MALFGKKTEKGPENVKKSETKVSVVKNSKDKKVDLAWRVLKMAHVTEKATALAENNRYVFNVYPTINKTQIKKSVEDIYGVNVVSVNIINIPAKRRRLGKTLGWKSGYKKAIVQLKEGQEIELMPR